MAIGGRVSLRVSDRIGRVRMMIKLVKSSKLSYFSYYCFAVAILVISPTFISYVEIRLLRFLTTGICSSIIGRSIKRGSISTFSARSLNKSGFLGAGYRRIEGASRHATD